jgi:hypothetical protein
MHQAFGIVRRPRLPPLAMRSGFIQFLHDQISVLRLYVHIEGHQWSMSLTTMMLYALVVVDEDGSFTHLRGQCAEG